MAGFPYANQLKSVNFVCIIKYQHNKCIYIYGLSYQSDFALCKCLARYHPRCIKLEGETDSAIRRRTKTGVTSSRGTEKISC